MGLIEGEESLRTSNDRDLIGMQQPEWWFVDGYICSDQRFTGKIDLGTESDIHLELSNQQIFPEPSILEP